MVSPSWPISWNKSILDGPRTLRKKDPRHTNNIQFSGVPVSGVHFTFQTSVYREQKTQLSSTKPEPDRRGTASFLKLNRKEDEHRHHCVDEARVPGHRSEPSIHHSRRQLQHPRLLSLRHHHRRLRHRRLPLRSHAHSHFPIFLFFK